MSEGNLRIGNVTEAEYYSYHDQAPADAAHSYEVQQPPARLYSIMHKVARDFGGDDPHIHVGFYEIYLFLEGDATYYYAGERRDLLPGDLIMVPPGALHKIVADLSQDYGRIVLHVSEDFLRLISTEQTDLSSAFSERCHRVLRTDAQALVRIVSAVDRLAEECEQAGPAQDVLLHAHMAELLVRILRIAGHETPESESSKTPALIQNILTYINAHLTERMSIQQIAEELNVSRSLLCHEFSRYYGDSLWHYVIQRRLALSQQLLTSGASVTDACFDAGFQNYSNFIKVFARTFGITPRKYAVSSRSGTVYL